MHATTYRLPLTVIAIVIAGIALLAATPARAQEPPNPCDPATYEPALLPITPGREVPGSFGSMWSTTFWVRIAGEEARFLSPGGACAGLPGPFPYPPGLIFNDTLPGNYGNDGSLIWLERGRSEDYEFSLRVFETTRPANAAGIELPVITLNDAPADAPVSLLDVTPLSGFRALLRIYDLNVTPGGRVAVRIHRFMPGFPPNDESVLREVQLHTDEWSHPTQGSELTPTPGFAALPLDDFMGDELWIEILPLAQGQRLWAMVTITNNDTQQVSLVTPSRAVSHTSRTGKTWGHTQWP